MKYRVERRLKRNGQQYEEGDTIELTQSKDGDAAEYLLERGVIARPGNSPASSDAGEGGESAADRQRREAEEKARREAEEKSKSEASGPRRPDLV